MNNHLHDLLEPVAESTHLLTECIHQINLSEKLTDIATFVQHFRIFRRSFVRSSSRNRTFSVGFRTNRLTLIHSHEKVKF